MPDSQHAPLPLFLSAQDCLVALPVFVVSSTVAAHHNHSGAEEDSQAYTEGFLQTSSRNHEFSGGYAAKRGHVPQLSISDDNHHVTEAIGNMYDDYDYGKHELRPLSFTASSQPGPSPQTAQPPRAALSQSYKARNPLAQTMSRERLPEHVNGQGAPMGGRSNSSDRDNGPLSPTRSVHLSNSETANSHFPLNDLDYESNPAAVAQELSNLQALRRMSMDVNAAGDPDLPSFSSNFGIPSAAPTGAVDEDDSSRLFWVPARIHPELAPTEFKTFLDSKVNSIKRRSGEMSLSPGGLQREGSGGGLRRKKSMLSRQIDNSGGRAAEGYQDGAERLDRKRSSSGVDSLNSGMSNLQDLEVLVNNSESVMQRLSIDTQSTGIGGEVLPGDDVPILPVAPTGNSLRRSTRTTYRRGSVRKQDRVPFSKRVGRSTEDGEDSPLSSPITPAGEALSLSRIQTEPLPTTEKITKNFSRPERLNRRTPQQGSSSTALFDENATPQSAVEPRERPATAAPPKHFVSQIASNGRSSISPENLGVPKIVETPPPPDDARHRSKQSSLPERKSSHDAPPSLPPQGPLPMGPPSAQRPRIPAQNRQNQGEKGNQTLKDMAAHPSPLPGNSTRTDSLSFIPTLTEDRKADVKKTKDKKDKDSADGSRKSSWSWGSILGSEEKEKERKKEEEAKKSKLKLTKPIDKSHDGTRLDLLQTTMEGNRGRESVVLDRGDLKLEEERKKESSRKSSGSDTKKEKDSGLFSSLFGGGKKKGERESVGKKHFSRNLSPEPPQRILKPDIDYNWTRFSILEERAIYRMAHIKLANPRRALHSQVLLSNFMYSYLAKVQQMHPQIQIPQSAAQKHQQAQQAQQAQHRKADQPEEYYQYQKYHEVSDYFTTHIWAMLTFTSNNRSNRTRKKRKGIHPRRHTHRHTHKLH